MKISRRGVLAGAAAGGGLAIAYVLLPQRFDAPLAPAEGEVGFNAWLKIATDGVVTVAVPQCEMGQGVTTLIPQIVAMELGADWRQIAVEPAPEPDDPCCAPAPRPATPHTVATGPSPLDADPGSAPAQPPHQSGCADGCACCSPEPSAAEQEIQAHQRSHP